MNFEDQSILSEQWAKLLVKIESMQWVGPILPSSREFSDEDLNSTQSDIGTVPISSKTTFRSELEELDLELA